jgi:hypothetical protein
VPVPDSTLSLGADVADSEVDQFDSGFVTGEVSSSLGDLAELIVDGLDEIRDVDDLPSSGG